MLPALKSASRRLQLDIEPGSGFPGEGGDSLERWHLHTLQSSKFRCGHFRDQAVHAEYALEMIVMGDDDHAVLRHLRVELPHFGSELRRQPEGGESVFTG